MTKKNTNICPKPTDAQTALNEITDHLLGKNWYVTLPLNQEQVNTIIVSEIKERYKNYE